MSSFDWLFYGATVAAAELAFFGLRRAWRHLRRPQATRAALGDGSPYRVNALDREPTPIVELTLPDKPWPDLPPALPVFVPPLKPTPVLRPVRIVDDGPPDTPPYMKRDILKRVMSLEICLREEQAKNDALRRELKHQAELLEDLESDRELRRFAELRR